MAETPHINERRVARHETRDVQIKPIVLCAVGLLVIMLGVLFLMDWTFDVLTARRAKQDIPTSPLAATLQPLSGPRLQITPAQDLRKLRAEEDAVLSSYGWVDRANGIVRMPIERAIDLLVVRGLPAGTPQPGGP